MASQFDKAASAAGSFSRAGAATLFVSAVPIVVVSLTVGVSLWLANNFLSLGSGR
jgi:hypothetical protein